jgi:acyl-CoA synthetase (AMP-forming)/AMP-acid ligase II
MKTSRCLANTGFISSELRASHISLLLDYGGLYSVAPFLVALTSSFRLGGTSYTDVLHIYGVSRAGFVPQLFSLRLPSPVVVFELLQKANAKALIFDTSFGSVLSNSPVPIHLAVDADAIDVTDEHLPKTYLESNGNDTAFVFHTSGSTSGSPKLVPCSYTWLNTIIDKASHTSTPKIPGKRDVTVWIGSMCHIAQTFSSY